MDPTSSFPLGVVPIFVNAGAALLPAIIAGISSFLAILARPREFISLCRRRPRTIISVLFVLILLAIGIPLLVAALGKPADSHRTDWAKVARTILSQQAATQQDGSILKPLWHHNLDGAMGLSTPRIIGGRLIVAAATFDLASKFGAIYAFDPVSGNLQWKTSKDAIDQDFKPFFSTPAASLDQKRIIIGQGLHEDADCSLLCFETATGKLLWSTPTPLHIESSPVVLESHGAEIAVVGVGAIEGEDRKPQGNSPLRAGYVLCVKVSSGRELWKHSLADPESSPAVTTDGSVIIGSGFNGNAIVKLDAAVTLNSAAPNRQLARQELPCPGVGNVTVIGNRALIGGGNGDFVFSDSHPAGLVACFDTATLTPQWRRNLPDSVLGPLTVRDETVYAGCRDGALYALSLADGKILWQQKISAGKNESSPGAPVLAGVAADGARIYALAANGTLAVLDRATGKILQRQLLSDDAIPSQNLSLATPVIDGDRLYVATETAGMHCFKIQPATAPED